MLPQIRETGAHLVAISPQLPEWSARIVRKHRLEFAVLSDRGNEVAGRWGLVFPVEGALRETYEGGFRLSLPRFNGDDSWTLPIPARFVLGPDGKVLSMDADPDYTRRPEPEATVEFLRSL